jgi:serine/threonine-protein kinase
MSAIEATVTAPGPWHPGETVGKHRLMTRLAIGGMAEIWLALQSGPMGFGKLVVIKRIAESFSSQPQLVQMFLDEARIAAQLRHPNIVQIFDLGEHAGAYYLTMEYLHGEDLAAVVRKGRDARAAPSLPFIARVVASAAEGLSSAHHHVGLDGKPMHIVHRDVSPQNIFITYDGAVKVLDFGVALATGRLQQTTSAGQVKGKFGYMSPEQVKGEPVDMRTDVWALGVVLFEACTQTRLFDTREGAVSTAQQLLFSPIPAARDRNPRVPSELDDIISSALQRDIGKRTPSALQMQRDLEGWLKSQPDAPTSTDIAARMRTLFEERLTVKQQLLESVLKGDPSLLNHADPYKPLKPPTGSMPSAPATGMTAIASPKGIVATLAVLLVLVGIVLAWKTRAPDTADLSVTSVATDATVWVDDQPRGPPPVKLSGLRPGEHVVALETPNARSAPRRVTLEKGQSLLLDLAPPAPQPRPEAKPAPEPVAVAPPVAPALSPVPPRVDPPAPRRSTAKGQLTLETQPWTSVYLSGKLVGQTPLIESVMPAGHHQLKLVNEEKGLTRVIEVDIAPGQTTVLRLTL